MLGSLRAFGLLFIMISDLSSALTFVKLILFSRIRFSFDFCYVVENFLEG